jgi:hypothetical protein
LAKIPVKRIWIRRAEGPTKDLGELTVASYREADEQLARWARTAPKPGSGVNKTDFQVMWANGETYDGVYGLEREDTLKSNLLGSQIQHFLGFHAGLFCPQSMTREQYEAYLDRAGEGEGSDKRAEALNFLQNYEM